MGFSKLYRKYWPDFVDFFVAHKGLSNPLLLDFPKNYTRQKVKLFVVGQQTNSWCNDDIQITSTRTAIRRLMEAYKNFLREKARYGPFWNTIRRLETMLKISDGEFLWSNLNKIDQYNRRPSMRLEKSLVSIFPVLASEIRLAEPDVVVFFTGPLYDSNIELNFPGAKFEPIRGYEKRQRRLCRVVHKDLPDLSFRTYHPKFLRLNKIERSVLDKMVGQITKA